MPVMPYTIKLDNELRSIGRVKHTYQLLVFVQVKSVTLLLEFNSTKVLNPRFRVTAAEYKTTPLTVRTQRSERAIYNQQVRFDSASLSYPLY
jgi:hypothetical protein